MFVSSVDYIEETLYYMFVRLIIQLNICLLIVGIPIITMTCSKKSVNPVEVTGNNVDINTSINYDIDLFGLELAKIIVSAPDFDSNMVDSILLTDNEIKIQLDIPSGDNRKIDISLCDSLRNEIARASKTLNIKSTESYTLDFNFIITVPYFHFNDDTVKVIQGSGCKIGLLQTNMENIRSFGFKISSDNEEIYEIDSVKSSQLEVECVDSTQNIFVVSSLDGIIDWNNINTICTFYIKTKSVFQDTLISNLYIRPINVIDTAGNLESTTNIHYKKTVFTHYKFASNLIGHWTFSDLNGDSIIDSSLNTFNGYSYGSSLVEGAVDSGRYFDGIDDYIQIPIDSEIEITDGITIMFWMKLDSGYVDNSLTGTTMLSRIDSDGLQASQIIYMGIDEALVFSSDYLSDSHYQHCVSIGGCMGYRIDTGTWRHYIFVINNNSGSSSDSYGLVDGFYWYGCSTASSIFSSNFKNNLFIGCSLPGMEYFKGTIDELIIYNDIFDGTILNQLYLREKNKRQ